MGGDVAPGYEPVRDAFADLMNEPGEVGAAFAAYVGGASVIDLWGGERDRNAGALWREDTVQLIFSGTKGLVATCILLLIERGRLALDQPVATYWPDFAQSGKDRVLVRHLVSHQAGLPALDGPTADLTDSVGMAQQLARQAPLWPAGSAIAYHALTFGWLWDGLIRRVDGRSTGRLFAEEVAAPLQLEAWIGLPKPVEGRLATMHRAPDYQVNFGSAGAVEREVLTRIYTTGGLQDDFPWNDSALLRAEIPAVNAVATARSMARLYGCLALGGAIDGIRLLSPRTVGLALQPLAVGPDRLTGFPDAFSVGFELQSERMWYGPEVQAFGHSGAGGSVHGAWPRLGTGFSYSMNLMRRDDRDGRAQRLLRVLHESVSANTRKSPSPLAGRIGGGS